MLINTELEFLFYIIASLAFAIEFVDTFVFVETRDQFINFIKV